MIIVKRSDEVMDARDYLVEMFVEGFYKWLKIFSKDKNKLKNAFKHIFELEHFYLAKIDGVYAGMAAVSDQLTEVVKLQKKELTKHLGFIVGRIAHYFLKKEFAVVEKPSKPLMPEISFVSVLKSQQRKGIAFKLIDELIKNTPYNRYTLEVASSNYQAIALYEKLGFNHYSKHPVKNSKQAGFDYYIYMVYQKNV